MGISERLKQLVDYKGISLRAFALQIGTSSQVFGKYIDGRHPSFEVISAIIETFDDINAEWLLTGKGEMIKGQSSSNSDSANGTQLDRLLTIIESQQRVIENLSKKTVAPRDEAVSSAAAV